MGTKRSSGTVHTPKGVNQGNTLIDPNTGQPVTVITDNTGKKRLAVDANVTIDSATVDVDLDYTTDSIQIGDPNTSSTLKINPDGSIDANTNIDSSSGDNIAISDGTNTLSINPDGSINTVLTANNLDIRDLVFANDKVDVTGSNVQISNFPTVQIIEGRNTTLTGTANSNNTDVIASTDVSGYDTIIIHNIGTFNLSVSAQFSNDNVNWVSVLGQTLSVAGTAPTTNLNSTNTIYKIPVSGKFFRYRTTAYTSGTILTTAYVSVNDINDFGSRNNTISGTVTTTGTITAGNIQVTGTGAAVNATPIAATTVGQYDVATVALTGTWIATLVAEGSNDGTNWFIIPIQLINSLSSLPQNSITSNGLYKIPLQFNNFRLRITSFTSGTVNANARISAIDGENLAPKLTIESGTLTNVYNEVLSVASGVLTTIVSFTATQNTRLKQVDVSGENIANYEVLVNGNVISKKRTYFGNFLDHSFFFDKGINFTSGQQVVVRVIHNRPTTANFNANIIVIEG